jgi:CheY-like chemotaxis protein
VNASRPAKILLIEDEAKTARAVLNGLKAEGFAPAWAETGEDGFFLLNSEHFDVVVLDWMLPGRSGLEVLKTVRAKDSKTPVLLLTARDALEDRVAGLDSGGTIISSSPSLWPNWRQGCGHSYADQQRILRLRKNPLIGIWPTWIST